ncbi:MAG: DNA-binding response regulator [Oleibacter sp.]|nr:DNA-binding response regulator [Thalassolituus sp.]
MRILIVDDNQQIMATLAEYLELDGFGVDCAYNGQMAIELVKRHDFDVIIMDIMMPRLNGIDAVNILRNEMNIRTPIIFLTAKNSLDDKTAAFNAGGDDYLIKPFAMEELLLRIHAVCRRSMISPAPHLTVGSLMFDINSGQLSLAGEDIHLSPIQSRIVQLLMTHYPAMVSRQRMIDEVWQDEEPDSDALRSHMYAIRQIFSRFPDKPLLKTLPGKGYCLEI